MRNRAENIAVRLEYGKITIKKGVAYMAEKDEKKKKSIYDGYWNENGQYVLLPKEGERDLNSIYDGYWDKDGTYVLPPTYVIDKKPAASMGDFRRLDEEMTQKWQEEEKRTKQAGGAAVAGVQSGMEGGKEPVLLRDPKKAPEFAGPHEFRDPKKMPEFMGPHEIRAQTADDVANNKPVEDKKNGEAGSRLSNMGKAIIKADSSSQVLAGLVAYSLLGDMQKMQGGSLTPATINTVLTAAASRVGANWDKLEPGANMLDAAKQLAKDVIKELKNSKWDEKNHDAEYWATRPD